MWIGGDFNLPDIDWSTNSICSHQYPTKLNDEFLETFDTSNLQQIVNFGTRKDKTLDILLTNRSQLLKNCESLPGFGDHDTAVLADIFCHPQKLKRIQRKIYLWTRANLAELRNDIRNELQQLESSVTSEPSINNLWTSMKSILLTAQDKHVPSKLTSTRYSQPWFNRDCKQAVRKKTRRYRVFKRTKLDKDWERYKQSAKTARKTCSDAYKNFIRDNVSENGDKNKKRFFSFIKSKKSDITGATPLNDGNKTYTKDEDIAELLNKQFTSAFSTDDGKTPEIKGEKVLPINKLTFTKNGIVKLLKELDPEKASGPDGVSARLLKECADEVANTLVLLFTASMHQGRIPNEWKHATISPLFKGGNKNRSKAENYRPISLTSVCCKIMEHIVHSHIMNHFDYGNILSTTQHGFRKHRSCETQLIQTVHDIAKSINNCEQIDSILLDFSKAFDKVCHRKLILKLKHYGICGNIINWIANFLSDRTQCVVVRGSSSKVAAVLSGVPQGTVLGPLLFLAYINDMPLVTNSNIALFADDSYIYRSINSKEDADKLQHDLDKLVTWEKNWSMKFHPDKCKLLRITNKRNIIDTSYYIHGIQLENVEKAKYLGITLTRKLSWNAHISGICTKAHHARFFLQRNLVKSSKDTRLSCYKTFIRPIVEYASTVWDPSDNENLSSQIEMVQRKALRWIFNSWKHSTSPTKLRQSLKLKTLDDRRKLASLKMLHEIVYKSKYVNLEIIPKRQRCSSVKFQPLFGRIKLYAYSFFPKTVRLWNRLPAKVRQIEDLKVFKNGIDEFFI